MSPNELESELDRAQMAEQANNFLVAAFIYKSSLEMAIKAKDAKLIKHCKKKLVEMNKKAISSGKDFKEVELTHEFSENEQDSINKFLNSILSLQDFNKILQVIGLHPFFVVNLKQVEETAKKTIPVFYQFGNLSTISDKGHTVRGSAEGNYSWFMQIYGNQQKFILQIYLGRLMYMLMQGDSSNVKLTLNDLSSYFSASKVINKKNLEIILTGLKRYFEEDYISALHILVPQFESLLLTIAESCGIDIIALDQKRDISTRTKILSEYHLDSEEFKSLFGKDYCRQVKFILFEPLGYKIRHKIAHGEISPAECSFGITTLILYLYLVLLARVEVRE